MCVFTKAPVPGQVKTRLIPTLGEARATELYQTLLTRTLETACSSDIDQVRLYCTPTTDHPELIGYAKKFDIELWLQQGDDLGARMCKAMEDSLAEFDYALVLGCDCPWLKTEDLNLAYNKLASNKDVVLGPAEDGGYYLLGFRSSNKILFENMSWGGPDILQETRRRLRIAAIDWFEIAEYPDLDVPEDLPAYERLLAI